jgi:hypothetical protein
LIFQNEETQTKIEEQSTTACSTTEIANECKEINSDLIELQDFFREQSIQYSQRLEEMTNCLHEAKESLQELAGMKIQSPFSSIQIVFVFLCDSSTQELISSEVGHRQQ